MRDITKIHWHFWHIRPRSLLKIYLFFEGARSHQLPGFPYNVHTHGTIVDNIVTKEEELLDFRAKLWQKLQEDSHFILKVMHDAYRKNEQDKKFLNSLLTKNYTSFSNEELIEIYNTYLQMMSSYGVYVYTPLAVEPLLAEEVRKRVVSEQHYDIIMTPVHESEMVKEQKSLLQVALGSGSLSDHVERFSFLKRKGLFLDFFDVEYYQQQLRNLKNTKADLQKLELETQHKQQQFQKLLQEYDEKTKLLFQTTNEAISFRTWRTERMTQSSYYLVPLFHEIAARINCNYKDLLFLLPQEVSNFLTQKKYLDLKIIKQRKEAYIFLTVGEWETFFVAGKQAQDVLHKLHFAGADSANLSGQPAFKGSVTGKVTVVNVGDALSNISRADVLVTHATIPEMVPYLKNVKAIVTEEGGILSHAAVISREMKIPCVIGTGNATKILKNGDIVEVDATRGLVKVLKK